MQEIAPHIYIETGFAGVTLGVIDWSHSLILIDAPFRLDDIRIWRSALLNMGGGADRLLVNLDSHYDRTLGTRSMECIVIGHEDLVTIFRDRPVSLKTQFNDTGSEWEVHNSLGSVRWNPPDISFKNHFEIHWDGSPIVLEHHPGPGPGAIWVNLREQRVLFVGDAVSPNQPPFLANADLPSWINTMQLIFTPEYGDYIIVSGRDGLITHNQARTQLGFLEKVHNQMEMLAEQHAAPSETRQLVAQLVKEFDVPAPYKFQYEQRLQYGLKEYYIHHYDMTEMDSAL